MESHGEINKEEAPVTRIRFDRMPNEKGEAYPFTVWLGEYPYLFYRIYEDYGVYQLDHEYPKSIQSQPWFILINASGEILLRAASYSKLEEQLLKKSPQKLAA